MSKKTNILRSHFVAALVKDGWVEDKFGHFKFDTAENKYRIKMQAYSFRLEVQTTTSATAYSKSETHWVKVDGAFYKAMVDLGNGKIKAGRRTYGTGTINYL